MMETAQAFLDSDDPHSEDSVFSKVIRDNLETWEAELKAEMRAAGGVS